MSDETWRTGRCWLCDAPDVPIAWLGPVHSATFGAAPLHACAPCVDRLEQRICDHHARADQAA
ncbi:hypothetical protein [Streptomyces sp. ODS05-4]|uniref:hypothetical protein n=1 Tax=Streptomyces sp. ODS05-4 TaxID=2944939 RepID=UPI00210867C8|nr:hypothetical protein [Streptomyces sp. ODS05-4]